MTTSVAGRGWQGAVMKLFNADDFEITVTRTETVTDHYLRIGFSGGLLEKIDVHPTMWVRCWFEAGGSLHQRGYTLVNPDPETDTFDIEFALHDGTAAHWAERAQPGDVLPVTVMGSDFSIGDPPPAGWLIAGDTASLPAVNSLLDSLTAAGSPAPATVWLEYQHDSDRELPLHARPQDTISWIPRENDGQTLVEAVRAAADDGMDTTGHRGWVALDSKSTRAVTGIFRNEFGLGRKGVKSMAYWKVGKAFA